MMHPVSIFSDWKLSGAGDPPPRVRWMREKPLAFIGAWEPLSFRQRTGYAYTDEVDFVREKEFSDEALDRYLAAGANSIVIPFAKGFGLKATSKELVEEKDIILRAHRKGLKAGTYIRVDALIPEVAASEFPEVRDWLSVGMYGRHSMYSSAQSFRKRICYLHPGSIRWLEQLIQYAIQELHADLLHLDGFHVSAMPWETCRCSRCVEAYRRWLKTEFADECERERIWGIVDFDHIDFPEFEPSAPLDTVLSSVDVQVWHRFLWEKQLAFTRHIRRFVRELNPDVAITANPMWGMGRNSSRTYSEYNERILPWLDAIWTEDNYHLEYKGGHIRSRLGLFKTAREHDIPICHYHWSSDQAEIEASLSLSIAANGGNPSCLGFSFRYLPHYTLGFEAKQGFAAWADRNWELLGHTMPYASVALIRHHASLAWNARTPWLAAMSMEQLLIRMQIPWRLFDTIDEQALSQVRTVLLPDMESLSDAELLVLKRWVVNGGRLFFTAKTATHDEYRRRRPQHGILNWLPNFRQSDTEHGNAGNWYEWMKTDFLGKTSEDGDSAFSQSLIESLGKGSLGFWPEIKIHPFKGCTVNAGIQPHDLLPPVNANVIEKFIRTLHGDFDMEAEGPSSVLVDYAWKPKTKQILIHVIRTDADKETVDVELTRPSGWPEYDVISPPNLEPPLVDVLETKLYLRKLARYAVIVTK